VITDGLTDIATSNRQLVFFKNNAMPNIVYMLDADACNTLEHQKDFERKIREKYQGTANSYKPMASTAVKDIKILEMSHKDLDLISQRLFAHKEYGIEL